MPDFLLDTHILIRWVSEARRLTREQSRVLDQSVARGHPVAISAVTLIEIALLASAGRIRLALDDIFTPLQANPLFQVLPLTYEIAREFASIGDVLPDPNDRAIVATARVHRLRLVTSDQRIIESGLVKVID